MSGKTINSPKSTELAPSHERLEGILLAEELAYAHADAEHSIRFNSESPEENNAKEILETLVKKYPAISGYLPLFENSVNRMVETKQRIGTFWQGFVGEEGEVDGHYPTYFPGFPEANPAASKKMIELLFGVELAGEVIALKTDDFILFEVGRKAFEDIDKVVFKEVPPDEPGEEGSRGARYTITTLGFPIVYADRGDEEDLFFNWVHEKEHADEHINEGAKSDAIDQKSFAKPNALEDQVVLRIVKEKRLQTGQEKLAKSELLAYFTLVWWKDFYTFVDSREPIPAADAREMLNDILSDTEPGEGYHHADDPRIRRGPEAVEAMVSLRDIYLRANPGYKADKITACLLSQFPLRSWGAVAKMIQEAHEDAPVRELITEFEIKQKAK